MTTEQLNKGTSAILEKSAAQGNTSFIGRYLAAKNMPETIMANKRQIMDQLDPDQKIQNEQVLLSSDQFKKQREMAYDLMPQTIRRQTGGTIGKNMLLGGTLLGGLGAAYGGLLGAERGSPGVGALAGLIGGGLVGSLGAGAGRLWNQYEQRKITPDDIAAMKSRQKDRGRLSELMPFRDVYDAATA